MKKTILVLCILLIPVFVSAISIEDVMKRDFGILPSVPRAHIHTTVDVSDTINTINVWQKLDLSTGSPHIIMQGGFTWDTVGLKIIWDENDTLDFDTECLFVGSAQVQVTSSISGIEVLELGLVINGGITPPKLITPISFTNQSKINGFSANENFSNYDDPVAGDTRLQAGDYIEVYIRSTTNTPAFTINGMNITFTGR